MLNEKMGVPDGIEEQGRLVYEKLINKLNSMDIDDLVQKLKQMSYRDEIEIDLMDINLEISDIKKTKIPFVLEFTKHESIKKLNVLSASNQVATKIDSRNGELKFLNKKSRFGISLAFNDKLIEDGDVKNDIISEIKNFIKPHIISHELKHFYDNEKKKENTLYGRSEYVSYQISGFPKMISEFTYLLYYMTASENLVRPSELYHMLSDNEVTKDNFDEFVSETEIMKNIEKARNFNLSDFISELDNNDEVKVIVDGVIKDGYVSVGSYGEDILNLLFINISDKAIGYTKDVINQYLITNSFTSLMSFLGSKVKEDPFDVANRSFMNVVKKYDKYEKNTIKYFEYLEKKLNFMGDKMRRKLYKLYDMVGEDKNKTDNSIINWDLHTKINSKNEKLLLKFVDFKNIKLDIDKRDKK